MPPSRRRRIAATLAIAAAGALWVSCGESDTGGPCSGTTCTSVPSLSCPTEITVSGAPGGGEAVTYTGVVETGGTPPVSTTCVPASGATFPVGTTAVSCTARDAINRSAVCAFNVTLTSSRLSAMHFLAFGDSTTAGENGIEPAPPGSGFSEVYTPPTCGTTSLQSSARALAGAQARPQYFNPATSYPQQLLDMLKARFAGESFVMENEGQPGEAVEWGSPSGAQRFVTCFQTDRPNVLLLLEGINDIAGANPDEPYDPTQAQEQTLVNLLRNDVSVAIGSGVSFVFVSTILPVANCQPDSGQECRGANPSDPGMLTSANGAIDQVNALIRTQIGGATIVDGNAAFMAADPTLATLIDVDGLHPTDQGYRVLAQAWMNAIAAKVPVTSVRR